VGGGTCYVAMHLGKAAVQRCGSPGVVRRCRRVGEGEGRHGTPQRR